MPATRLLITACILARNEESRIEDALRSLGWTDQILVIDNESDDGTVEIARRYNAQILTAPRATNFDAARNLAIEPAVGTWILFLDADEHVPPRLAVALRRLIEEQGDQFEALFIPFKHYFCGKWMEHSGWWPGYTRPQLLKKGCFHYNERLHSGVAVEGRTLFFPADDPDLAIVHYSYDNLHHYLEKLNRYTDGEAESLLADGASHSWQAQLAHFVADWQTYYERGRADLDGMHGFVLSFMSAFYRFAARAKLWDLRRQAALGHPGEAHRDRVPAERVMDEPDGKRKGAEQSPCDTVNSAPDPVPANLREMLEFMARVAQEGADPWLKPSPRLPVSSSARPSVPLLWHGPLLDPSGYADEARQFVLGLLEAGEPVAVAPARWSAEEAGLAPELRARLEELTVPVETPAELFVSHTLPLLQRRSPQARFNIARTMFETDRLPEDRVAALNAMDRIWVPSEFNRETFVRSGVDPAKIAVIPGALDPAPFASRVPACACEPWPVPGAEPFRFLSVFDWTLHKGWDVLLEAFAREFGADTQVGLILKVWSSNGYTLDDICAQAGRLLHEKVGRGLAAFPNIHLWQERLDLAALPRLYRAVDAFVLPTRGEGWCRPLMEAMAAGLPTIATAWSGLTAFHNARVGYPLKHQLWPVSEAGAREIPLYAGHCWAEPDIGELRRLMRRVVANPEEASKKGNAGRKLVASRYSRSAVAALLRAELAICRELAAAQPAVHEGSTGTAGTSTGAQALRTRNGGPYPNAAGPERLTPLFKPTANRLIREPAAAVDFRAVLGRPLRVRWEGDQSLLSSLALVNRELCLAFLEADDVELSLGEARSPWHTLTEREDARFGPLFARRDAALSGPPDVTVRHQFPPNWERPASGKLVVIQPWEYGHLPRTWVRAAQEAADEVWAYSRFVRDVYVRSGVPAEKVRVVPLGFNPAVFTPDGPQYPLRSSKSCRFLFVGGALERKGADLLLAADRRAFTATDDACLVVKDMGTRSFYHGQTAAMAFREAQADTSGPEVTYLDDDLGDAELGALYRAATCVVLPYRGEGFGLSPLEGMACGKPAIVTAGGPTDDYLDDSMGLRVPHRRRSNGSMSIGPFECVADPWVLEPDPEALAGALRWVYEHPEEVQQRGEAARAGVEGEWTWAQAGAAARARLSALVAPCVEQAVVPARLWSEPRKASGGGSSRSRSRSRSKSSSVELSLCMIVRDEEARIGQCLESAAPFVDEITVVDTGSRDRTREIARDWGARVYQMPWPDSFAAARNESIERARGDWVIWLDADDVIEASSGRQLRVLIRRHPLKDAAYQVQVRIPPGPGEYSPHVVDHVKLFPRRPDLRFEHRIHEQILPSIRRAGLRVLPSDVFVTHQNYDRSPEGQARKRRRDFRLLELDLRDRPDHPFVLFNLGMTYLYATKDYEVAAYYLQRSLERSDWQDSIVRKAHAMRVQARLAQGEWDLALAANEEGRRYYPEDAELLFQAGQVYQQAGRFEEARRALEKLVGGKEEPHYRSVDTGLRTYRGRHELALLFGRMGDGAHCERVLKEIAAAHPAYLPARLDLVETLHGLGQREEALRLLAGIPDVDTIRSELRRLRERVGT